MAKNTSSFSSPDDKIIQEAQDRFKYIMDWESFARKNFEEDIKFVEADSDNGYQWPQGLRYNRDMEERPCLTINKTRQHCLLIVNDARENKPGIKFMPTGNEATFEAAQIWGALARSIEYKSNAQAAYDKATDFMVKGGVGYWRVVTEWADNQSFNQEIYIRPVNDPMKVAIDPEAKEADKSDMNYAFIFENIKKSEFDKRYPQWSEFAGDSVLSIPNDWANSQSVRIAEYFRRRDVKDTLFRLPDGTVLKKSDIKNPERLKELEEASEVRKRPLTRKVVEWFMLVGQKIVERKVWVGSTIPIVMIYGEETVIDGQLDRKGHTRAMKDPQRMYNYWSSAAVEYGALQSKTPYLAPAEAIEGYEVYWNNANRENFSVLPYNAYDDAGQPLSPPSRQQPPVAAPVAITGMQVAQEEFSMVSGQYGPQMGAVDNSRTGKAISERQRQGDKATYHYINNLAVGVRYTGKILLDIIPKIYDIERVMEVVAEDGTSLSVKIDPDLQQAFAAELNETQDVAMRILNPSKGQYEVIADVGPGYATKREEAFNAMTLILTQAPALSGVIGDLLFRAGDFPMAEEAAERLRRMVPAQALGKGPSQSEQQLQQQLQQLSMELQKTQQQLAEERLKTRNKAEQKEIGVFKAITERMKVAGEVAKDGLEATRAAMEMETQLNLDLAGGKGPLAVSSQEAGEDLGNSGPTAGLAANAGQTPPQAPQGPNLSQARMAPDGNHYLPDPNRPGKYLQVK